MSDFRTDVLYRDSLVRILKELSLFYFEEMDSDSDEFCRTGRTMEELSSGTGIHLNVIREDVFRVLTDPDFFTDKYMGVLAVSYDEEDTDTVKDNSGADPLDDLLSDFFMCEEKGEAEKLKRQIHSGFRSGNYDKVHFYLNGEPGEECLLVLTTAEYSALSAFLKTHGIRDLKRGMPRIFEIKNILQVSDEEQEKKSVLQNLIDSRATVCFVYRSLRKLSDDEANRIGFVKTFPKEPDDDRYNIVTNPVRVEYDSDAGLSTLVDSDGYKYRLDRIQSSSIRRARKGEIVPERPPIENTSVKVKIKIREILGQDNPYSTIYDKILADLKNRNTSPDYRAEDHLTEGPGGKDERVYIYEDSIEDIGRFKTWIYSYGKSMIVLEPRWLGEEIIGSYKARRDRY